MPKYQISPTLLRSKKFVKSLQDRRQKYSKIAFWVNEQGIQTQISTLADAELAVIWSAVALGCLSGSAETEGNLSQRLFS